MAQCIVSLWQELKVTYKKYQFTFQLTGAALIALILTAIGGILFAKDSGYNTNLYTDLLSIFITVTILDVLARRREENSREKDLQEQLVRDASSLVNDVAVNAIHQMRKRGWLEGANGLLKKAVLNGANLNGANLNGANLNGANLNGANLNGARLDGTLLNGALLNRANLNGAHLGEAHLGEALLRRANLKGANLKGARLDGTLLRRANLNGANLNGANLEWVDLEGADLREATLPNGEKWTPDTDMKQFTAPDKT